ncbi:hypothetical protein BJY16_006178 [Actinoplanes octamycinicus]|uniref:Uncharacterized protein n=1 Tax=Actinoplanes octamycinicus TaxID=135948 RepID=A0A7W7H2E5_9ACTN|nr:hypothetical protein [Actinoplanes octamycinicus]MBB4742719.1 hypothetical protein [Actinoplanes octamycinicus]GIE63020.1 hypothetical protein Aoc01nite_84220 [Actinoplanes octamycinicus]
MEADARYRQDARLLAQIGEHLAEQLHPVTVRLPARLAAAAAQAWERDEPETAGPESPEQAVVRSFAAAFALLGIAVQESATAGDEVVVTLRPEQVASALVAAELQSDHRFLDRS